MREKKIQKQNVEQIKDNLKIVESIYTENLQFTLYTRDREKSYLENCKKKMQ